MHSVFFKVSLVFTLVLFSDILVAQLQIKAVVTDQHSKEPIPYAYIRKKNTNRGAITNEDGFFQLNCSLTDTLIISFVSYDKRELAAKNLIDTEIIYLQPSLNELKTVEVYGNFDFLYALFDRARKKMKRTQPTVSKTYFTMETSTQGFPMELLECYYNAEIDHSGINKLALKNGRIGLSEAENGYFTSLSTTQIISNYRLMNKNDNQFPNNPLQLTKSKLAKAYNLKLVAFENGVYKVDFVPRKKGQDYFNATIWIDKVEEQVLKMQLSKSNLKRHPFIEINEDDEIDSLNYAITYTFSEGLESSLDKIEFNYDLIYTGKTGSKKMESQGVFLFFDKSTIFDLPYYSETDDELSDYDKIVSQPYNASFWHLNEVISPSRKTVLYQNYFKKTGVLLNFDELAKRNDIFKNRVISWSANRILVEGINKKEFNSINSIEVQPTTSVKDYTKRSTPLSLLYNLSAHVYLDRNTHADSVYYCSETLIDVEESFYYLDPNKNTTCFINLYYDLVEVSRRKLMGILESNVWTAEQVDSIYVLNEQNRKRELKLFLAMVERGEKDDKMKSYIKYIHNELGIDNSLLIWSDLMAIQKKEELDNRKEWVKLYNYGTALLRIGQFEAALPFFLEALAIDNEGEGDDPWLLYNIGINYIKLGEIEKGCSYLLMAKEEGEKVPQELISDCE